MAMNITKVGRVRRAKIGEIVDAWDVSSGMIRPPLVWPWLPLTVVLLDAYSARGGDGRIVQPMFWTTSGHLYAPTPKPWRAPDPADGN